MKRIVPVLLALALLLSGCALKTGEELYSLPKPPEDYLDLQAALEEQLAAGASYAAPVGGANRQSVQLVDIDADGEKEAVAFFRTAGERPLRVCVFKKTDGAYRLCATVEGAGSAINAVEYLNLDGRQGLELLVSWQVSALQYLGAYSLEDWRVTELMSAPYTEYRTVDLDLDGRSEVFLLRADAEGRTGVAQLYRYDGSQMAKEPDVAMSVDAANLRRVITGYLEPGVMAVFAASLYEQGIVTDVFVCQNSQFYNASLDPNGSGLSAQTVRNYYIYADDIDDDGLVELPRPEALPPAREDETDTFWVINWYNLGLDGHTTDKLLTYHNFSAGWYLQLPERWRGQIAVYRTEGTVGWIYTFARLAEDGTLTPVVHISPINGDGSGLRGNWFVLGQVAGTYYAALIPPEAAGWSGSLTAEELQARFHPIRYDWNMGET